MIDSVAGLRLLNINHGTLIVAAKSMPIDDVRAFYETEEGLEVVDLKLVPFFDKPNERSLKTYADIVIAAGLERLPAIL